jgi:hypothetical protein
MRVRAVVVLLAGLAVPGTGASPAVAGTSNAATTHAYVEANYALMQAASARIPSSRAGFRGVLAQVQRECPLAAAASPEDTDSEQLSNEVIGAMVTAAARPDRQVSETFRDSVARLQWSNGALTKAIRGYVHQGKELFALASPNLCADVRAWVASGYQTLPTSTVQFDASFLPNWIAPGYLPAQLKPYESAGESAVLHRTEQLEQRYTEFEASAVETYGEIMNALDLQP